MSQRFQGRSVLVTGAAAGLGRGFAEHFAAEGAQLILVDVDEQGLAATAARLRERGAVCATHRVDLADEAQIHAFGAQLCREHPRLDVLVNNAGLAYGEIATGFIGLGQEKWLRYLAINSLAQLTDQADLISIRPKLPKGTMLMLTGYQRLAIVIVGLTIPLLLLISSAVIWFRRRGA